MLLKLKVPKLPRHQKNLDAVHQTVIMTVVVQLQMKRLQVARHHYVNLKQLRTH